MVIIIRSWWWLWSFTWSWLQWGQSRGQKIDKQTKELLPQGISSHKNEPGHYYLLQDSHRIGWSQINHRLNQQWQLQCNSPVNIIYGPPCHFGSTIRVLISSTCWPTIVVSHNLTITVTHRCWHHILAGGRILELYPRHWNWSLLQPKRQYYSQGIGKNIFTHWRLSNLDSINVGYWDLWGWGVQRARDQVRMAETSKKSDLLLTPAAAQPQWPRWHTIGAISSHCPGLKATKFEFLMKLYLKGIVLWSFYLKSSARCLMTWSNNIWSSNLIIADHLERAATYHLVRDNSLKPWWWLNDIWSSDKFA